MKTYTLSNGQQVLANSRIDALKRAGLLIYWEGNKPYGLAFIESKAKVYARLAGWYLEKENNYKFYTENEQGERAYIFSGIFKQPSRTAQWEALNVLLSKGAAYAIGYELA
jgi:hypothetical protein